MTYPTECPDCKCEFEYDEDDLGKECSCPNCGKKYYVNWDCDHEDAVIIADWEVLTKKDE